MQVYEIMSRDIVSIDERETIQEASKRMKRADVGSLPVTDENFSLCGIITDRDIVTRCIAKGLDPSHCKVKAVMTETVRHIDSQDTLHSAALKMARHKIRRLPVVEEGALRGMVSLGDLAKYRSDTEIAQALSEITTQNELNF